jgi:hypothetical protein
MYLSTPLQKAFIKPRVILFCEYLHLLLNGLTHTKMQSATVLMVWIWTLTVCTACVCMCAHSHVCACKILKFTTLHIIWNGFLVVNWEGGVGSLSACGTQCSLMVWIKGSVTLSQTGIVRVWGQKSGFFWGEVPDRLVVSFSVLTFPISDN